MVQRLFAGIGFGKFLLLWGFSLAFGLSNRAGGETPLPLHLLVVLNDQYYLTFAILPILLFLCDGIMEDDAEAVILRYGRYGWYFVQKWKALSLLCGGAWLGQIAALALSGWGLPLAEGWCGEPHEEILSFLAQIFPTPGTALLCAAFYLSTPERFCSFCRTGNVEKWRVKVYSP